MDPSSTEDYLAWQVAWNEPTCRLGPLEGVEKAAELAYNLSRAEEFSPDACFRMNAAFPDDTLLADRLFNQSSLPLISQRTVDLLREEHVSTVEYLRVTVIDHRERPVESPYFVLNPLNPVDCLDLEACKPEWNRVLPDKARSIGALVLDPDKIDSSRRLFTCDVYHKALLIHRELAELMQQRGLTGSSFVELQDYRE